MQVEKGRRLTSIFSLCTQPNSTVQTDMLIRGLLGAYFSMAQFDYSVTGLPFNTLVNSTLKAGMSCRPISAAFFSYR